MRRVSLAETVKHLKGRNLKEYVNVRASETLDQGELVSFLRRRFPTATRPIGRTVIAGTECVEARVLSDTPDFDEISQFIRTKREKGVHGYSDFEIGWYLRKYTKRELQEAEALRLKIHSHFEPPGEVCGTIYETLCRFCNWGRQVSDLILDLRRVPQHKDISETIAWVEWVVSSRLVQIFSDANLTGAEFRPVIDIRYPTRHSEEWHQLFVTQTAGRIADRTKLGRDPFSPSQVSWKCPLGHSIVAEFLSQVYLHRDSWDGSDISVTTALFGQGRNLLRPVPLIIVSQRLYREFEQAGLSGFSFEPVFLI